MLIRFSVANFRSFNEEVVFSMIPGRSRQHENHIIKAESPDGIDVLRMGLLYGANASGKSNLIKAMAFARNFIVEGVESEQPILVEPFRLNSSNMKLPSRFEFEFIIAGTAYAYGFELDGRQVREEWLTKIFTTRDETVFERTTQDGKTSVIFETDSTEKQFFEFVARSTRENQLFLTNAVGNNVEQLTSIFRWFRSKLVILTHGSVNRELEELYYSSSKYVSELSGFLKKINSGIQEVKLHPIPVEAIDYPRLSLPEIEQAELDRYLLNVTFRGKDKMKRRFATLENGELKAFEVKFVRRGNKENNILFDFGDESDGTQKVIDLYPIFYLSFDSTVILDELERSLHPNLVRLLIQHAMSQNSVKQFIFTTHEATLLDLDLLRRDEIWFVEKSPLGASTLYSLEEFKPRHDLDIRKGYLQGRFGAIPVFGNALQLNGEVE